MERERALAEAVVSEWDNRRDLDPKWEPESVTLAREIMVESAKNEEESC